MVNHWLTRPANPVEFAGSGLALVAIEVQDGCSCTAMSGVPVMQFLTNLLGGSDNNYVTVALALGIVLVLIVLGLWLLKLMFRASNTAALGRNRRLSVVDTLALDPRRQLVIVRRDNVEHLLLVGGAQDIVVEAGIPAAARPERQFARPTPAMPRTEPARRNARPDQRMTEEAPPPLPAAAPQTRAVVEQLRSFARPAEQRRPTSLRHTGLLRPVSTLDPGVVRLAPENSDEGRPDSARSDDLRRGPGGGGMTGDEGFGGDQGHQRS